MVVNYHTKVITLDYSHLLAKLCENETHNWAKAKKCGQILLFLVPLLLIILVSTSTFWILPCAQLRWHFSIFFEVSSPYQWITGNQKRKPISRSYPYLLRILTSFEVAHTQSWLNQLLWLFSAFFVALIHLSAIFHPKTRKKSLKKCFKLLFKAGRWPTPQGGTSILSLLVPFPTIFIESNFLSMSWMKNKYEWMQTF